MSVSVRWSGPSKLWFYLEEVELRTSSVITIGYVEGQNPRWFLHSSDLNLRMHMAHSRSAARNFMGERGREREGGSYVPINR